MEKNARWVGPSQERGIGDWFSETFDLGGISEKFSPELQDIMTNLRKTDAQVRSLITGKSLEGQAAPDDTRQLKDVLKSANSLFNRREYISAIAELGKFHDRISKSVKILQEFAGTISNVHQDFLFKDVDDEMKNYLINDLHMRFGKPPGTVKANMSHDLVSEAGIVDVYKNWATDRGRALRAWEKRYPRQIGTLKNKTKSLISRSENLLNNITSVLKQMSSARNAREVDKYITLSQRIINDYNRYNTQFDDYYKTQVKGFVEKELSKSIPEAIKSEPAAAPPKDKSSEAPAAKAEPIGISEILDEFNKSPSAPSAPAPSAPAAPAAPSAPAAPAAPSAPAAPAPAPASVAPAPAAPPAGPPGEQQILPLGQPKTKPTGFGQQSLPFSAPQQSTASDAAYLPPPFTGMRFRPDLVQKRQDRDFNLRMQRQQQTPKANVVEVVDRRGGPSKQIQLSEYGTPISNSNYQQFIQSLEKLSNESPIILAKYISKYAQIIEKSDPLTAHKLMNIVKLIEG